MYLVSLLNLLYVIIILENVRREWRFRLRDFQDWEREGESRNRMLSIVTIVTNHRNSREIDVGCRV